MPSPTAYIGIGASGVFGVVAMDRLLDHGAVGVFAFTFLGFSGMFFAWLSSRRRSP